MLSYLSVQYLIGKRGAGRTFFFGGGEGGRACNVNRQNPLWREDLDLEHLVILGVGIKHVLCLESPCL